MKMFIRKDPKKQLISVRLRTDRLQEIDKLREIRRRKNRTVMIEEVIDEGLKYFRE